MISISVTICGFDETTRVASLKEPAAIFNALGVIGIWYSDHLLAIRSQQVFNMAGKTRILSHVRQGLCVGYCSY